MTQWIVLAAVAAVVLYAIVIFNRLVRTRQLANEAWSGIDVQLKRRADLVPNLVETVKGYASHERQLFEDVTRLRNEVRSLPAGDVEARAKVESALSGLIGWFEVGPRTFSADRSGGPLSALTGRWSRGPPLQGY